MAHLDYTFGTDGTVPLNTTISAVTLGLVASSFEPFLVTNNTNSTVSLHLNRDSANIDILVEQIVLATHERETTTETAFPDGIPRNYVLEPGEYLRGNAINSAAATPHRYGVHVASAPFVPRIAHGTSVASGQFISLYSGTAALNP